MSILGSLNLISLICWAIYTLGQILRTAEQSARIVMDLVAGYSQGKRLSKRREHFPNHFMEPRSLIAKSDRHHKETIDQLSLIYSMWMLKSSKVANGIQHIQKQSYTTTNWGLSQECKVGLKAENQLL